MPEASSKTLSQRKRSILIVVSLLILALAVVTVIGLLSYKSSISTNNANIDEWIDYSNAEYDFALKHPTSSVIDHNVELLDPPIVGIRDSTFDANSEKPVGFSVTIDSHALQGESVQSLAEKYSANPGTFLVDGEVVFLEYSAPESIMIDNKEAFVFYPQGKKGVLRTTILVASSDNESFFNIEYIVSDAGYQQIVDQIIQSIKFTMIE